MKNAGVKKATAPSEGVWYAMPQRKTSVWTIVFLRDDEMPEPEDEFDFVDNTHFKFWKQVKHYLQNEFKLSNDQVDELGDNYTGLPRGRISVDDKGVYTISHGNDFLKVIRHQILAAFGLLQLDSIGKVKWSFNEHEKMHPREKKIVWKVLEL